MHLFGSQIWFGGKIAYYIHFKNIEFWHLKILFTFFGQTRTFYKTLLNQVWPISKSCKNKFSDKIRFHAAVCDTTSLAESGMLEFEQVELFADNFIIIDNNLQANFPKMLIYIQLQYLQRLSEISLNLSKKNWLKIVIRGEKLECAS